MLAHVRRIIDGDTVGAAKIKDDELPIGLIFDLSVIARDALVFDDNVIAQLTTYIDDRLFDAVYLLACLWQLDSEPRWRQGRRRGERPDWNAARSCGARWRAGSDPAAIASAASPVLQR